MTLSAPRLIVVLPVPPVAAAGLAALPRRGLDATWVAASALHITLRYLGHDAPAGLDAIDRALRAVTRPPFSVEIDGLDVFAAERPAVLFAKVASARKTTALCTAITDALTPLGFDFGMRPYQPHVTLARVGDGNLTDYVQRHGASCRAQWQADEFALAASADAKQPFRLLHRYRLA